jgi:hypothetical protein
MVKCDRTKVSESSFNWVLPRFPTTHPDINAMPPIAPARFHTLVMRLTMPFFGVVWNHAMGPHLGHWTIERIQRGRT